MPKIKIKNTYASKIKRGFGLSAIRNQKELEAIIEFCRNELKDTKHMKLNPVRKRIYEMTVLLYEQNQSNDKEIYTKLHKFEPVKVEMYNDAEEFINDYVGWYWN